MERLPHNPGQGETRVATCPEHGDFESRLIINRLWTRCPQCAAEANERERVAAEEQRRARAAAQHERRLAQAGIPARFIGRSFDSFKATADGQARAVSVARDYAEQFEENHLHGRGLIFGGLPGTGKSHLAAAILQTQIWRNVRYLTCLELVREVRGTWRKDSTHSESRVIDGLAQLDLLVIDELGASYGTDGEQTIVFDILDRRYRDVLPTILLTNEDLPGLKSLIGERAMDRLSETCRWISFNWPSYRAQARDELIPTNRQASARNSR